VRLPVQTAPDEIDLTQLKVAAWPVITLWLGAILAWGWIWAFYRTRPRPALVPYRGRRPVPWSGWYAAAAFAALYVLLSAAQLVELRRLGVQLAVGVEIPAEIQSALITTQMVGELVVWAGAICLLVLWAGANRDDLGLPRGHVLGDLWLGVVSFCAVGAPVQLLYLLLQPSEPQIHPLVKLAIHEPSLLWLLAGAAVLVAPLVEEFFFRVVLQGWLERRERQAIHERGLPTRWPIGAVPVGTVPILISSFLFALAHIGNWPAPVPLFFLALVLGYLYHQTHRLLPSLVVHMLLNGTTFLNLWLAIRGG
jgi:membrane protease YdiL (CAAX protease family)